MNKTERLVSYYDLRVESSFWGQKALPSPVPLPTALQVAKHCWGRGPYTVGNRSLQVTLEDWKVNERRREHYLLFNRTDASLADIPLRDVTSGAKRMAGKKVTEGIDLSCHVLIKESAEPKKAAVMLMTLGSSLAVAKVATMLTQLFRQGERVKAFAEHFSRPDPSGAAVERRKLRSVFRVDGHQSLLLSNILRGGGLEGVDLISDAKEMLDVDSKLMIAATEFKVIPTEPGTSLRLAALKAAIGRAPRSVDLARVHFRRTGSERVETHTFKANALDAAFVRKEVLHAGEVIQPRYEEVNMNIIDGLRQLLE